MPSLGKITATLLGILSISATARAGEEPVPEHIINNNGSGIVAGPALAEMDEKILSVRVITPLENGSADLTMGGARRNLPGDKVAVIDDANCWRGNTSLCVGDTVKEGARERKILGYFPPSGDVIVREGSELLRVPHAKLEIPPAPEPLGNLGEVAKQVKGKKRLHLRDFLQTWEPGAKARVVTSSACSNKDLFGRKLRIDKQGFVEESCAPKVLYSWSLPERFRWFRKNAGKTPWSKKIFPFTLYAVRSPAATFGYGSFDESGGYLMRIELEPGTRIRFLGINTEGSECKDLPPEEVRRTVYARVIGGVAEARILKEASSEDFFLCSTGPIRSWSRGTKRDYDEFALDVRRALAAKTTENWDAYTTGRASVKDSFQPVFLDNVMGDAQPFTQRQLINSFKKFLLLSAEGRGDVMRKPVRKKPPPITGDGL